MENTSTREIDRVLLEQKDLNDGMFARSLITLNEDYGIFSFKKDYWSFVIFERLTLSLIKYFIIQSMHYEIGINSEILEKDLDLVIEKRPGMEVKFF